jgi:hypothetical protein
MTKDEMIALLQELSARVDHLEQHLREEDKATACAECRKKWMYGG